MKRIILFLAVFCISIVRLNGQVADGITYQAVALDDKGKEIAGHDINGMIIHSNQIAVRFSILRGTQNGDVLYQETHSTYTDQYGLFSLVIGHGDVTNEGIYQKLTDINWGADMLFLQVEIDIRSRGDYKLMGIQQMMAVPFAFHAMTSSAATVSYSDILNTPTFSQVAISGRYDDLINKPAFFSGSYDDLTNKPAMFNGDYNSLINQPLIPVKVSDLLNDAGYVTDITEVDPIWTLASANYYNKSDLQTSGASQVHFDNITNRPTTLAAYGITDVFDGSWSDLTGRPTTLSGYGITDAISTSHPSNSITESSINNWNSAFGWGNHAGLYMPVTYVPSWNEIISNPFSITSVENDQLLRYNSTTGKWENWTPDFQKNFAESDPVFAGWDKNTGIIITSSQVSDFEAGVANNPAVLANSSKNSYPLADASKLAGIASGAEVNVNADWNATSGDAQILNKPILATVATTGNYTDLIGLPVIPAQYTDAMADLRVVAGITGKVDKVAGMGLSSNDFTSAEKTKLTGIAPGAEVNVNADWNATSGDAQILNKPTLAPVAASGNYTDLAGLPTIPTQYTDAMADLRVTAGITGKVDKVYGMGLTSNDYTTAEKTKLASIPTGAEVNVNADWIATSGDAQILNKPALATVAISGNYSDLAGLPAIPTQYTDAMADLRVVAGITGKVDKVAGMGLSSNDYTSAEKTKLTGIAPGAEVNVNADWNAISGDSQILNKPALATVAISGNYTDLAGLPAIPTQYTDAMADLRVVAGITGKVDKVAGMGLSSNDYSSVEKSKLAGIASGAEVNVNADWNATSGDAQILNKPVLAPVATSGNYTDLSGLPTIPTQYTDAMADLRVVAGITGKVDKVSGMGLTSNDYTTAEKSKLSGIASGAEVNVNADWNATSGDAQILNKPSLSTVATSGNYADLTNKPVTNGSETKIIAGANISITGTGTNADPYVVNSTSATGLGQFRIYYSNSSFVVPAGVTRVLVEGWAGGGGGGGGGYTKIEPSSVSYRTGGSGQSGAYTKRLIMVVPGETINITIGAGGLGGCGSCIPEPPTYWWRTDLNGSGGQKGGNTTFGSYLTLTGGAGGGGAHTGSDGCSSPAAGVDGREVGERGTGGCGSEGGDGYGGMMLIWY